MDPLPQELLAEIDTLVARGHYPTRQAAIEGLLRLGLDTLRRRTTPQRPGEPPSPVPRPPGYHEPEEDRPIEVHPWDTKWI